MLMPAMGGLRRNKIGALYATGRMVKSKEHRLYSTHCDDWANNHKTGLDILRKELKSLKKFCETENQALALHVDVSLLFHKDRILTVNNKPLRIDLDNRLKALNDNLFRILGIDDKHIFKITAQKLSTESNEHAIIKLSQTSAV